MLNERTLARSHAALPATQQGVVLMMALVVLVAMTLAGLALIRSVDTATIVAGNLAFKQSATHSADSGTEAAVAWLQANAGAYLDSDHNTEGYSSAGLAAGQTPLTGQSWDTFWSATVVANSRAVTLSTNAAGNTVAYTIQRLCLQAATAPTAANQYCARPQSVSATTSSSKGAGVVALLHNSQIYYRVTSRVTGPRNTISYVQAIVAQ